MADYYQILGVSRRADQAEVKRAFRSLAMRYHPDRNPDDVEADRRFKEVVEAYEVLSDPEKRRRYDRMGPLYKADGRPPTPEEISELLSKTLGGLFSRRRKARGRDREETLTVTLQEILTGCERSLEISRQVRCKACDGQGATPDARKECEICGGSGKSRGRLFRSSCPHCDGRGWISTSRCEGCGGEGLRGSVERLKVRIPAGAASGLRLKLKGRGDESPEGRKPGDLFVIVKERPHPLFTRRGKTLECELPLKMTEAAIGVNKPVPTLDGPTVVRIAPGTGEGRTLRLRGRGLPGLRDHNRGDLLMKVSVEIPQDLSDRARELIQALDDATPLASYPRCQAFEEARGEHETR